MVLQPAQRRPRCTSAQIHNTLVRGVAPHDRLSRSTTPSSRPTPFDCEPFVDTLDPTKGSPLMITQKKDELLQLPPGVAYTLQPNQMVRLEMHYINATQAPLTLTGSSTMTTATTSRTRRTSSSSATPTSRSRANSTVHARADLLHSSTSDTFGGVNFFAFTGHEHKFGTNVTVQTAASADRHPATWSTTCRTGSGASRRRSSTIRRFTMPDDGGFKLHLRLGQHVRPRRSSSASRRTTRCASSGPTTTRRRAPSCACTRRRQAATTSAAPARSSARFIAQAAGGSS